MNLKRLGRAVGLLAALTLASPAATHAEDIVRIASAYRTTTLDPALSAAAGNIETYGQLYGRLIRRAADGSLEPGLAESWAVSDDGKTVTLKIRDAKFSDGSPITADDVVFSLLRVRDLKESAYSAPLQQLAEAKAGDAQTVILTLKSAFAPFVGNLEVFNTGIVSKKDVETRGEAAFTTTPVTSGPYVVKEWRPNDRLILAANPHYWREGYPKNDGAELIEVVDDNTRVTMMIAGELDAARGVPWSQVADLKGRDGISMPLEPSTVIFMTLLNHSRAPFNDLKVRQAAAHAIDTVAVTKAMTFGYAATANTTLPGAVDFHDKDNPGLGYDVEDAKKLLKESSYDGKPATILITDSAESERLAVLLQAQWAVIGLNAKIEKVDGGVWWERVPGADYDAAPTWWYNETPDPDLAVRWALCGTCGSESYYTKYNNAKVDELTETAARELDPVKRGALYKEIQTISTEEVAQIPLYYPPYANAYGNRIKGLMMTPSLQWTLEETEVVQP
ncbi:ABC transporter substrate-binding protein [Dongia mobilis]|uniref:ABC transporter substrate-binding protein n=1 Tax=Dongia sp. TaxID=1977262 RepID=UPI0026EA8FCC